MCLLKFRGNGYSPEFIDNMNSIIALLSDDTPITLKREADCVCRACPNRVEVTTENPVGCRFSAKVSGYDEGLLRCLELDEGITMRWGKLKKLVIEEIFPANIDKICCGCEWLHICRAAEPITLEPGSE